MPSLNKEIIDAYTKKQASKSAKKAELQIMPLCIEVLMLMFVAGLPTLVGSLLSGRSVLVAILRMFLSGISTMLLAIFAIGLVTIPTRYINDNIILFSGGMMYIISYAIQASLFLI